LNSEVAIKRADYLECRWWRSSKTAAGQGSDNDGDNRQEQKRRGIELAKLGTSRRRLFGVDVMTLGTILLVLLVLLLIGALPAWPHSRSWGYFPSGGLGVVLLIVVVLLLIGRI
jgi:hypothetical protein